MVAWGGCIVVRLFGKVADEVEDREYMGDSDDGADAAGE